MIISIITLFPEMFEHVFNVSIMKRAQEKEVLNIRIVNLRDFGIGKHKIVDDKPYGGGIGMVLRVDVLHRAIESVKKGVAQEKVILLDPKGTPYAQSIAENLSKLEHIILVCGHYEGFDERIRNYIDMEISIGDYVLSGGEIPAMVVLESVARLVPGVLQKTGAVLHESFSEINGKRILEHPHYTRPAVYKGKSVPKILVSGDKGKIEEHRTKKALQLTKKKRPDILKNSLNRR